MKPHQKKEAKISLPLGKYPHTFVYLSTHLKALMCPFAEPDFTKCNMFLDRWTCQTDNHTLQIRIRRIF